MISYQWDSQTDVIQIKDALEASGYDIWMDLDDMRGNIYQKMAEGVEGAQLIIMCMSSKYQTSVNCNKEFQYAQDRRKRIIPVMMEKNYKPSGALGLIVAGAKYVDFSDLSQFSNKMEELMDEISACLGAPSPGLLPVPPTRVEATSKTSQDHYMKVGFVETRSGSWNDAADKIIDAIRGKHLKRDQLLSIDAHNNGKDEDAIFSAFFDWNTSSSEELNIAYEFQNDSYGWKTFYTNASNQATGIQSEDVISMTGCCNCNGRSVFYVFSQVPSLGSRDPIKFTESRAGGWDSAANAIIGSLVASGVKRGQLLYIDAHNNGEGENAIFSAFWNPNLADQGPLSVGYKKFNAKYGWQKFYENIIMEANQLKRKDFISITGSVNCSDSSVMYLFYYQ